MVPSSYYSLSSPFCIDEKGINKMRERTKSFKRVVGLTLAGQAMISNFFVCHPAYAQLANKDFASRLASQLSSEGTLDKRKHPFFAALSEVNPRTQELAKRAYMGLPLSFERNQGQADRRASFLAHGNGYHLFLTPTEAVLTLSSPAPRSLHKESLAKHTVADVSAAKQTTVVIRMRLVGANSASSMEGLDELSGKANYFVGKDPKKWRANISSYAKVKQHEVYPGIDLIYYGQQGQLEYDFVVAPGADTRRIEVEFQGTDKINLDAQGNLVLHTAGGEVRHNKPLLYQEVKGVRQEITGSYVLKSKRRVGFKIGTYDASRPLVIDPAIVYSTYLGSSGYSDSHGIAVYTDATTGIVYAYVGGLPHRVISL